MGGDRQAARQRIGVLGGEDGHRAGVHDRRHPLGATPGRLEDVDRADDVDERAARWIGSAERDLQRRQVDDVGDATRIEDPFDLGQVGDVTDLEVDAGELLVGHDEAQPAGIGAEVERRDVRAVAHERPDRPRADTAQRARDEEALVPAVMRGHGGKSNRQAIIRRRPPARVRTIRQALGPSVQYTGH